MARFKTKEIYPTKFRMFFLSCDRPARLLLGKLEERGTLMQVPVIKHKF